MNKIAFILVDALPFPNVKGGAIETLLTSLADENEKYHNFHIDIYSIYDVEAQKASSKYKYTHTIYVKTNAIAKFMYRVLRKMKVTTLLNQYYYKCYSRIKHRGYELIIFEGGTTNGKTFIKFANIAPLCYHLHFNGYPPEKNGTYKYLIGVSDFVNREWRKVSPTQIAYTVRNGIDLKKIQNRDIVIQRNDLGISPSEFVVLYVGRIIEEKGIYELLCAVEQLDIFSLRLVVIGSANFAVETNTKFEEKVKTKIEALGKKVVFTGYIPNENLYSYYKMADIQVIPSMWEEAAGLVAIEGMAAGLPIIATKSGGMVEYLDSDCAVMIDRNKEIVTNIKNAIIMLHNDVAKMKSMSEAGLKRAELFSKEYFYQSMSNTIKDILER